MLPSQAIRRLRVRGAAMDSPALRLAVSHQLGGADLRVPGTPPSEVLLVRALDDPMPGRIRAHPAAAVDAHWEGALKRVLQARRSQAVRPRDGRVADGAEAVLFADEAEMIACLALCIAAGASARPWWREALARYVPADSLQALLAGQPEALPAVFEVLARWRAEEGVAAALPDAACRALVEALARTAGAPLDLDAPLAADAPAAPADAPAPALWQMTVRRDEPSAGESRTAHGDAPGTPPGRSGRTPRAPWRDAWRPAPDCALPPLQRLLVGFALALQRAPALARSARFAREARAWLQSALSGAPGAPAAPPTASSPASDPDRIATDAPRGESGKSAAVLAAAPGELAGRMPQTVRAPGRERHAHKAAELARPAAATRPQADAEEACADAARRWAEDGVPTGLGGVLYLVNVMEHLDLPECFEADCALASAVGAFGTLESLARALLGPLPAELENDALWTVLARLDRRAAHQPPRAAGLRAGRLRLPEAWLAQYGEAHATHAPADLAWLEARGWPAPLVRWLAFVEPFVRWRLARALGLPDAAALDVASELARLPAQLYLSDTHIDVVAGIGSVRMPLRLAGLDRSPGWVARIARVVLFHFE